MLTLIDDTPKDPNEIIKCWHDVECYLNSEYKEFERVPMQHYEALAALNTLFVIAEAWNKIDEFVPDYSNPNQYKYYPWFKYDKSSAGFVCADAHYSPSSAAAYFGSRLCFKSSNRAMQFGRQFIDFWNKVFLP